MYVYLGIAHEANGSLSRVQPLVVAPANWLGGGLPLRLIFQLLTAALTNELEARERFFRV